MLKAAKAWLLPILIVLAMQPATAQSAPKASKTTSVAPDGPSLDETYTFLSRVMDEGEVSVTLSSEYVNHVKKTRYFQNKIIFDQPTSCHLSWDTVWDNTEAAGGHVIFPESRNWISLKYLLISDLKVMDLKSALLGGYELGLGIEDDAKKDRFSDYTGYVLIIKHSYGESLEVGNGLKYPNPSEIGTKKVGGLGAAPAVLFSTQDDAERAKKAFAHAATLCGAKPEPF